MERVIGGWAVGFRRGLVLSVLLAGFGLGLGAEDFSHREAGIAFWLPDDWDIEEEGDGLLVVSPDHEAAIGILVTAPESIDRTVEALVDSAAEEYPDLELGDPEEGTHNGLDYYWFNGVGTDGAGREVLLEFGVLSALKPVVLYMILMTESSGNGAEVLQEIFDSMEGL